MRLPIPASPLACYAEHARKLLPSFKSYKVEGGGMGELLAGRTR